MKFRASISNSAGQAPVQEVVHKVLQALQRLQRIVKTAGSVPSIALWRANCILQGYVHIYIYVYFFIYELRNIKNRYMNRYEMI